MCVYTYIYIYICIYIYILYGSWCWAGSSMTASTMTAFTQWPAYSRGNHLSSTACLTQVFFESGA